MRETVLIQPYISVVSIDIGQTSTQLEDTLINIKKIKSLSVLALNIDIYISAIRKEDIQQFIDISKKCAIVIDFYSKNEYKKEQLEKYKDLLYLCKQIRFHYHNSNFVNYNQLNMELIGFISNTFNITNIGIVFDVCKNNYLNIKKNIFRKYEFDKLNFFYNVFPVLYGLDKLNFYEYYKLALFIDTLNKEEEIKINGDFPEAGAIYNSLTGICPSRLYQIHVDNNGEVRACKHLEQSICRVESKLLMNSYVEYLNSHLNEECTTCNLVNKCMGGCLISLKGKEKSIYCCRI